MGQVHGQGPSLGHLSSSLDLPSTAQRIGSESYLAANSFLKCGLWDTHAGRGVHVSLRTSQRTSAVSSRL